MPNKKNTGKIFVISGPSGSGKTTLLRLVLKGKLRRSLVKITTVTTRKPRNSERRGRDYYFVDREEFLRRLRGQEFIESRRIFGQYYGTPKAGFYRALTCAKDVVLCVDVKGALCIKRLFPKDSVLIFIAAPNLKSLNQRLMLRSTEHKIALDARLKISQKEIAYIKYYDYMIVNDKLSQATDRLSSIIVAEKLRVPKQRRSV